MDTTVTRIADDQFRITSGAATRWRDLALLRRRAAGVDVTIQDQTEALAVIGVMGAGSRALLGTLSPDNWDDFPFGTARQVTVSGQSVLATRISFVAELGWELTIDAALAGAVFEALIDQGAAPMGHYALDGCRIENGFKHWGHDLGPEITPLEAGLGFTIDWAKDFIGKEALSRQRTEGLTKRLCLMEIDGRPLMLHDEPICEGGRVVGLTTSGGQGPRTGLNLAFGLIDILLGETRAQTSRRKFEVNVAGQMYRARVLSKAPFDPKGERMRG